MDLLDILRDLGVRVDEDLPPAVIKRIGVDVEAFHLELNERGFRYDLRESPDRPNAEALRRSAEYAIANSVRSAGMLGAASGIAGMFGVPPEALARVIQSFRLAQRIAIIYGYDPESDRGGMHIKRALSSAWGFELPDQAKVDLKVSDLRAVMRSGLPALHDGPAWMARTLTRTATAAVSRRFSRLIPGLGAGMGLLHARRFAREQGERIHRSFSDNWKGPTHVLVEDAVEITA